MGRAFKVSFTRLMLSALGKALKGVYKIDARMRSLVSELPDGYTVSISISGVSARLAFSCGNDGIKVYKSKNMPLVSDLSFVFKNIDLATPMLVGKRGIQNAYAEHDFTMHGDVFMAMIIVDMISLVECYLFPNARIKKIMDKMPKRQANRGRLYAFLLLGI